MDRLGRWCSLSCVAGEAVARWGGQGSILVLQNLLVLTELSL